MSVCYKFSVQSIKMKPFVLVACLISIFSLFSAVSGGNIFCYFLSWTTYRNGHGKFDVSDINGSLCTHITYAFVGLGAGGSVLILDDWESHQDYGPKGFENLVALRQKNPNLKVMLSMGGWNEGSEKYSKLAANPELRKIFALNVLNFLQRWNFDGFDLYWQYPGSREGSDPVNDKDHFTALLSDLRDVLTPRGYLLSIAVSGAPSIVKDSYDIPAISKIVDFFNLMTYDYHGAFDPYVGHVAPLYASSKDKLFEKTDSNVAAGVEYWLTGGADPAKLNMGIITCGRSFTLANVSDTELYAPINGPGKAGPYTQEDGVMGYNEICEQHADWTRVFDDEQKVPHKISGNQWVGYEDPESLKYKVDYATSKKLGGLMVWSFDTDDFRGICGEKYPLMNALQSFR